MTRHDMACHILILILMSPFNPYSDKGKIDFMEIRGQRQSPKTAGEGGEGNYSRATKKLAAVFIWGDRRGRKGKGVKGWRKKMEYAPRKPETSTR